MFGNGVGGMVLAGALSGAASNGAVSEQDDATAEKLAEIKTKVHSIFGEVVLAVSSVPRYRTQSLADLAHLIIEPLARDRIAVASPKANPSESSPLSPSAVAVWASVSVEVDAKIAEQTKAGVFPIRLKPDDWASGEIVWLLDVIAPSREMATAVLANFNRVAKRNAVKIHPLVARLVDAEVLQKLVRKGDDDSSSQDSSSIN